MCTIWLPHNTYRGVTVTIFVNKKQFNGHRDMLCYCCSFTPDSLSTLLWATKKVVKYTKAENEYLIKRIDHTDKKKKKERCWVNGDHYFVGYGRFTLWLIGVTFRVDNVLGRKKNKTKKLSHNRKALLNICGFGRLPSMKSWPFEYDHFIFGTGRHTVAIVPHMWSTLFRLDILISKVNQVNKKQMKFNYIHKIGFN